MFDEILEKMNDEETALLNQLSSPNEEAEFLEDFLLNNSLQSFSGLLTIDLVDLMVAHISSKCDEFPFSYIKNVIYNNREVIEDPTDKLPVFASYVEALLDSFSYDDVMDALNGSKNSNSKIFASGDVEGFVNLFEADHDLMRKDVALIYCIKQIRESYTSYGDALEQFSIDTNSKVSDKASSDLFRKMANEEYRIEEVQNILQEIKKYGQDLIKTDQSNQRKIKKEILNYRTVSSWLNKNSNKEEISNIPTELLKLSNEDIKIDILKSIYINNNKYYNELTEKYNELSANSYNQYIKLFKKYGLSIEQYNINEDISIVEAKLEHISNMNIDNELIINLLSNSSLEQLTVINNLINNGYISLDFVKNNFNIFTCNYNNLIKNINYLKNEAITNSRIKDMENILIIDSTLLENNITILKDYDLFKYIKSFSDYSFLNSCDLDKKIDKILEVSLEDDLINNPDLLNRDSLVFDKALLLNSLNINISNAKEVNDFLDNDLGINKELIDEYIFDITPFIDFNKKSNIDKKTFINKLDEADSKTSDRVYNFDGVLISKNKVNRYIDSISNDELSYYDQITCLISNKKIDQESYDKMNNCIFSPYKQLIK